MADKSQSFRDVFVRRKARAFTLAIYRCTELLQGYINCLERGGS